MDVQIDPNRLIEVLHGKLAKQNVDLSMLECYVLQLQEENAQLKATLDQMNGGKSNAEDQSS